MHMLMFGALSCEGHPQSLPEGAHLPEMSTASIPVPPCKEAPHPPALMLLFQEAGTFIEAHVIWL
jgi:hypothetical protein